VRDEFGSAERHELALEYGHGIVIAVMESECEFHGDIRNGIETRASSGRLYLGTGQPEPSGLIGNWAVITLLSGQNRQFDLNAHCR
jgi:hypothetical protein